MRARTAGLQHCWASGPGAGAGIAAVVAVCIAWIAGNKARLGGICVQSGPDPGKAVSSIHVNSTHTNKPPNSPINIATRQTNKVY